MKKSILRGCLCIGSAAARFLSAAPDSFGLEVNKPVPTERREPMSLADAVLKRCRTNLDIHIGRQTKESRLADIIIEQAKFDPTVSLNGQYNRQVAPLNRPIPGFTGVLIARVNGSYKALDDWCNHAGCMLSGGRLEGNTVVCPCHEIGFDLDTGKNVTSPGVCDDQPAFKAEIEGETIVVVGDVPER